MSQCEIIVKQIPKKKKNEDMNVGKSTNIEKNEV